MITHAGPSLAEEDEVSTLQEHSADLVVVGLGYVGLPLALAATDAGLRVTGLDISERTVGSINAERSLIDDVSDKELSVARNAGFSATTDPAVIGDAAAVVVCVPTPLARNRRPDLSAVISAMRSVRDHLQPGTTVVLESTTYPGTTDGEVRETLEESGLVAGRDFFLAFSPERVDPGNSRFGVRNTPKVVGGIDTGSTAAAVALYERFVEVVVPVAGAREAEMTKLLENTFRHVNIAMVNEFAQVCDGLGIDVWECVDAAATKPFGFMPFYPGPGVGGHCIPIDPHYLAHAVRRQLHRDVQFIKLAEDVNSAMPRYVVERVERHLQHEGRRLVGARVLLLGVTYKADIADQRESPAVEVAQTFMEEGASVTFHDPHVESWHLDGETVTRVPDLAAAIAAADVAVLLQGHAAYAAEGLAASARYVFDTRGFLQPAPNVERL